VAVSHDTDRRTNVASAEDDGPRRSRRQVISFIAAGSFSAFVVGMWLYAFFIYDPGLKVDELADRTFPIAAERICAAGRSDVDALPPANVSRSATERAEVIDSANARLRAMIAELRAAVPADQGRVTSGVNEWLDDWTTYVDDRQAYADGLRSDPQTRFTETVKANRQVSRAVDGFAEVNRMESCSTPGDVG
jgi:hypothetical protein